MNYCYRCMTNVPDNSVICPYCGKPVESEIPIHQLIPGTVLNGKYVVGKALGEGGFGITYVGLDLTLELKVAIKEYYPNGYANRSHDSSSSVTCGSDGQRLDYFLKGKERFLNEARTLAKFANERGIVGVRDFFEANGTAYIVMEFLEGITLKEYIKQKGVLSVDETISLLEPIMKSLNRVHMQNLIHRDISPDNIMLNNGEPKLLDFGAARNVSAIASKSLSVVLKPGYAPEEQYRSKGEQGPWTDVYAICATMYKCITGITPDDATQRLYKDELKKPSELGVAINPQVEFVLMKGMSVLYNERFQNMDALFNALSTAQKSEGMNAGQPFRAEPAYAYNQGCQSSPAASYANNISSGMSDSSTQAYYEAPSSPAEVVQTPSATYSDGLSARSKNKKKIFIISGIVASVVLAGIIILIVCLNKSDSSGSSGSSDDNNSSQTTKGTSGKNSGKDSGKDIDDNDPKDPTGTEKEPTSTIKNNSLTGNWAAVKYTVNGTDVLGATEEQISLVNQKGYPFLGFIFNDNGTGTVKIVIPDTTGQVYYNENTFYWDDNSIYSSTNGDDNTTYEGKYSIKDGMLTITYSIDNELIVLEKMTTSQSRNFENATPEKLTEFYKTVLSSGKGDDSDDIMNNVRGNWTVKTVNGVSVKDYALTTGIFYGINLNISDTQIISEYVQNNSIIYKTCSLVKTSNGVQAYDGSTLFWDLVYDKNSNTLTHNDASVNLVFEKGTTNLNELYSEILKIFSGYDDDGNDDDDDDDY